MNPKFIQDLLKLQRDLDRSCACLNRYSNHRDDLSDAVLEEVEACSAKLDYEAGSLSDILDRYLREAVAKGGE